MARIELVPRHVTGTPASWRVLTAPRSAWPDRAAGRPSTGRAGPVQAPPSAQPAAERAPVALVPPGYELAWADEFDGVNADGTGLDESEWFYREGEKAECSNQPATSSVGDGLLHIAIKAEQANGEDSRPAAASSRSAGSATATTRRARSSGAIRASTRRSGPLGSSAYIPDVPDYTGPHNRINEIDGFEVDSHAPDKLAYHSHWFVPEHVGNQGNLVTQADTLRRVPQLRLRVDAHRGALLHRRRADEHAAQGGPARHPEHLAHDARLHRGRSTRPTCRARPRGTTSATSPRSRAARMARRRRSSSTTATRLRRDRHVGLTSSPTGARSRSGPGQGGAGEQRSAGAPRAGRRPSRPRALRGLRVEPQPARHRAFRGASTPCSTTAGAPTSWSTRRTAGQQWVSLGAYPIHAGHGTGRHRRRATPPGRASCAPTP